MCKKKEDYLSKIIIISNPCLCLEKSKWMLSTLITKQSLSSVSRRARYMHNTLERWVFLKKMTSLKIITVFYICRLWAVNINPLNSNVNMHILHTNLHTFPLVLLRSICLTIMTFFLGDRFPYSHKHFL